MSKLISVDLKSANLLWLQVQAKSSGGHNLSETLNEILDKVRTRGRAREIRSVRDTIRLPESDPDLREADKTVRDLFHRSLEQTAGRLADTDETEA